MKMVETVANNVMVVAHQVKAVQHCQIVVSNALLGNLALEAITVKSAASGSIKMNQAKVDVNFVMLVSIFTTTAMSFINTTTKMTVHHVPLVSIQVVILLQTSA